MSKLRDLKEEDQKKIMNMIFSNSYRNFQMMNAMHICEECGKDGLLFPEYALKLGFVPLHTDCSDEETTHNLNQLGEILKTHDASKKFKWVKGEDEHRKNPSGRGCQKCQPGMTDD